MGQEIIGEERVFTELKKIISKSLDIDENSIRPESVLTLDLNAESLDFLDISYNLEQTFGFKMARYFVLEHAEEMFGEGSAIDDYARLTEKGVTLLQSRFAGSQTSLMIGMEMDEVANIITVGSMVKVIMDILDTLPEKCTACGKSKWKTEDETHILCSFCGEIAVYENGDDLIVSWLEKMQKEKRIF